MRIIPVSAISRVLKESSPGDRSAGKRFYIAIFLFILIPSSIIAVIDFLDSTSAYLPGWFLLVLEPGSDAESASRALASAGVDGALSEWTADVPVMTIPETERVAVADLDRVLPPGDPRRDPYLSGVPKLFRSGDSPLIYLPSDRRLGEYGRIIDSIPELSDSVLLDDARTRPFLPSVVFAGVVLSLAAMRRERRTAVLVSSIPIFVFIVATGFRDAFPMAAVFCALAFLGFRGWRGVLAVAVSGTALFLLSASPEAGMIPSALIALAGSAAALRAFSGGKGVSGAAESEDGAKVRFQDASRRSLSKRRLRWKKTDHALFEPVSLLKDSIAPAKKLPLRDIAAGTAILICFAAAWMLADSQEPLHDPVPAAIELFGDVSDWSALAELDSSRDYGNLPDIAGLVASATFQEGFLYGAEYRLPMPGESLSIREYTDIGGRVSAGERIVAKYDREWFDGILERERSAGVGLLFSGLEDAAAVRTVRSKPANIAVEAAGTALAAARALVIALAAILLFIPSGASDRGIKYRTPINISRRRAQAA